jgi:DeoR family transcriptional regulator of aga operon
MIKAADQTILLADSSKFTKSGFYRVCDLEDIDFLITDDGLSKIDYEILESHEIRYFIV